MLAIQAEEIVRPQTAGEYDIDKTLATVATEALIYAMAAQNLQVDGEARVRYVSAVKLKKPEVIESDFKVDAGQLAWARGLVTGVKKAIDAELYHPAPSVMSCGGCPFTTACARSGSVARSVPKRIFSRR